MRRSRLAYHSGTWIPLVIFLAIVATYLYSSIEGLTWERPLVYLIGIVSLVFGLRVLVVGMYRDEKSGFKARFYPLSLAWTGFNIALLLIGLLDAALDRLYGVSILSEPMKFALIAGAVMSIAILSLVSHFGEKRDILADVADPVPFRSVYRSLRRKSGRRSGR